MNFTFLKYLFKKEKNTNIVLLIILMMVYPFINMTTNLPSIQADMYGAASYYIFGYLTITNFVGFIYALTFIMVIVNFRYLHSKRATDTYMQLPLKKLELFKTKLVYTMIQVVGFGLLAYWLGSLVIVFRGFPLDYRYIIYMSILMIISLSLIIFFNAYIYQKCNSMVDGVIIMIMYHLLLLIVDLMLMLIVFNYNSSVVLNFSLLSIDMTFFKLMFAPFSNSQIYNFIGFTVNEIKAIATFLLIGLSSLILSFREIKNRSSERAEQITKDHFCYPVIIIGFVWIIFMMIVYLDEGIDSMLIGALLIFIPYIIGMFIYNRKVMLKPKYIITYVTTIVLSFVFVYTVRVTDSFGLANSFPNNYEFATAKIVFYSDDLDIETMNINKDINRSSERIYSDNKYLETTLLIDDSLNRIEIYSSDNIDDFEKVIINSNDEDYSNTNNYDYSIVRISYFDKNGNVFDSRKESIVMDVNGFIDFVNNLDK